MKGLGAMIMALLMNSFGKIVTALGVSFVTYQGLDLLQHKFTNYLTTQIGSLSYGVAQLFFMVGGGVFLNWIFGAFAFVAAIKATSKLTASYKKQ